MKNPRVSVTGYLYPWDVLDDPGAAGDVAAMGVDRVALAASYHSVRAATPRHPRRRVVDARTAALYVPVTDAWEGQCLVPAEGTGWTGTSDAFGEAARELRAAGVPVDAWTVLTHSSSLGARHPQLCVRNAFGENYLHALCPSNEAVRNYSRMIVGQVLRHGNPDGLVLEAAGPLGFSHQNQHEKTEGADYSPWVQALLSLCFCDACRCGYGRRGMDAGDMAAKVRSAVLSVSTGSGEDHRLELGAGGVADGFVPLLECRWDATARLLDSVLAEAAARPDVRLSIHASPDPWATGPFAPLRALERSKLWDSFPGATAVLPCWGATTDSTAALRSFRSDAPAAATGAYVLALPPKSADSRALSQEWKALLDGGCTELHLYHLGLASTRRREAAAGALELLRGREGTSPEE
ncbi:hypothetical protein FCN77_02785 [Arthrobacter sp. 24S4-2]|uniref:hypothetical protein n=1 Tax=Arthrobacter sp. 24S4-2 TaxID=2575374 RepID=UPI0010C7A7EE|nr:hypothetical protein [Arthrobacter sp. 24S4-2]QCO96837.1 hypothetical protein FCN77_02785 [Arthrobacter sp. 24S4-2]